MLLRDHVGCFKVIPCVTLRLKNNTDKKSYFKLFFAVTEIAIL